MRYPPLSQAQSYPSIPHGKQLRSYKLIMKVVILLALAAVALANPPPSYPPPPPSYAPPARYPSPSYDEPPKYDYNYAVKDDYAGLDFGAQEARDGYDTQGSYYVLLPDGRTQKVTYTVNGDAGYVAEVTYEGEASYPAPSYKPAPSYPKPSYA